MIARVVIAMFLAAATISCAAPPTRWSPQSAAADAQHDIAAGRIRFAYIGGRASYAPGLPKDGQSWLYAVRHYPRLEVGPEDCMQDEHFSERREYAERYNRVMWSYLSKRR